MNVNEAVAKRVAELLDMKKMTSYKLAKNGGLWYGTLTGVMGKRNKNVTLATIIQLARGFDISVSEFLNSPLFADSNFEF